MKDVFVDDWELDKEFTDENFKPPKDALRDEQLNPKQIYYRYGISKTINEDFPNSMLYAQVLQLLRARPGHLGPHGL